jgi:hypothetical protein
MGWMGFDGVCDAFFGSEPFALGISLFYWAVPFFRITKFCVATHGDLEVPGELRDYLVRMQ